MAEVERLSAAYRDDSQPRAASSRGAVAAYLAYRAPATYAAVEEVFRQVALLRPDWAPRSLLDVGAGPGVAAWAAVDAWPSLEQLTLVEAEPAMVAAGRELLPDAQWVQADAAAARGPADLVVASYVLGELRASGRRPAVGADGRHDRVRRARNAGRLPPDPRCPRGRDRSRRLHDRTVPARPSLPPAGRRLVPLRDPAAALEAAPAGQGRRARLRGREVLVRGAQPHAACRRRLRGSSGSPRSAPATSTSSPPSRTASTSAPSAGSRETASRRRRTPPGATPSGLGGRAGAGKGALTPGLACG